MGGLLSQYGGTIITAALTFFGGVGIAWLGLLGKRSSSPAELLAARTSAWRELMLQSEIVISRLTVRNEELQERVDELEVAKREVQEDNGELRLEILTARGELRQQEQKTQSLLTTLVRRDDADSGSDGDNSG